MGGFYLISMNSMCSCLNPVLVLFLPPSCHWFIHHFTCSMLCVSGASVPYHKDISFIKSEPKLMYSCIPDFLLVIMDYLVLVLSAGGFTPILDWENDFWICPNKTNNFTHSHPASTHHIPVNWIISLIKGIVRPLDSRFPRQELMSPVLGVWCEMFNSDFHKYYTRKGQCCIDLHPVTAVIHSWTRKLFKSSRVNSALIFNPVTADPVCLRQLEKWTHRSNTSWQGYYLNPTNAWQTQTATWFNNSANKKLDSAVLDGCYLLNHWSALHSAARQTTWRWQQIVMDNCFNCSQHQVFISLPAVSSDETGIFVEHRPLQHWICWSAVFVLSDRHSFASSWSHSTSINMHVHTHTLTGCFIWLWDYVRIQGLKAAIDCNNSAHIHTPFSWWTQTDRTQILLCSVIRTSNRYLLCWLKFNNMTLVFIKAQPGLFPHWHCDFRIIMLNLYENKLQDIDLEGIIKV